MNRHEMMQMMPPMGPHSVDQQQDMSDHPTMDGMSMMKMFFHFGLGDLFLFKGFVLDSSLKIWLMCLTLFLGAILMEAIDYTRGYLTCLCQPQLGTGGPCQPMQSAIVQQTNGHHGAESGAPLPSSASFTPTKLARYMKFLRPTQAALQFIRTGLSLTLMLAAMTYNICLIFAIMLGAGVGFFIFYRPPLETRGICH